jgi:putative transposase
VKKLDSAAGSKRCSARCAARLGQPLRFLIHDRDAKFGGGCDHVFQSDGIAVIRTPVQAPDANAHAERWVGSVRRDCHVRPLIFSRRQLEHVLRVYTRHYNQHRPHRALALHPPEQADGNPTTLRTSTYPQLNRRDLLGGLIHEYEHAARPATISVGLDGTLSRHGPLRYAL